MTGFREWLVTRFGGGDNLAWEALVLRLAFPERSHMPARAELPKGSALNRAAVETLFALLDEFLRLRAEQGGVRLRAEQGGVAKIFDAYGRRRGEPNRREA